MNIDLTSLVIGWFSALILFWLVISLNSNTATTLLPEVSKESTSETIEKTNAKIITVLTITEQDNKPENHPRQNLRDNPQHYYLSGF